MKDQITISQEEFEIVDRVAEKVMRKMRWNWRWEVEDVRQDLFVFWMETKQKGWTRPENWQSAMGRCLNLHLKDLQKRECAQKRKNVSEIVSLDQMLAEGHDFPEKRKSALSFDFLEMLNGDERHICELLIEGKTKGEIYLLLKRSKTFINKRLDHVRHLAEEFLQI